MCARALNCNWSWPSRSSSTQWRLTGGRMENCGSPRWPIIRPAWTTTASPADAFDFLKTKTTTGNMKHRPCCCTMCRFPTGVMAWGKGVIVTAAPEIFYAEDSDGDGKADIRKTLFSGFLEGNQQLRVNGLRWGLDNWIHCASGSHHAGLRSRQSDSVACDKSKDGCWKS